MNTPSFTRRCAASLLLGLFLLFLLPGCKEDKIESGDLRVPRLMLEAKGQSYGALTADVVTLPLSRTQIAINKEPLVSEFDITNVELVKVDLGLALLVQTSELAARALYRATVTNMGGRIVLTVNGNAIAARRVESAIQDGNFYTFVELDDEALAQLVVDLKETLAVLREKK